MNSDIEIKIKKNNILKNKKIIIRSIFLLLIVIIFVICILLFINYKNNVKKYKNMNFYQYLSGLKYEYSGIITFSRKSGITELKSDKYNITLDSIPVYVKGKGSSRKMILPKTMGVFNPAIKNKSYKVSDLTMVRTDFDYDNQTYLLYDYNDTILDDSFMFDGDNTYVFFRDVSFAIDDKEYELSPMSYIIVSYKGDVEFYNYLKDEYVFIEDYQNDVILKYDKYNVNLSTDMIMYSDDTFKLLTKNVSLLPLYTNKFVK